MTVLLVVIVTHSLLLPQGMGTCKIPQPRPTGKLPGGADLTSPLYLAEE